MNIFNIHKQVLNITKGLVPFINFCIAIKPGETDNVSKIDLLSRI
jgi:hypothetical protein